MIGKITSRLIKYPGNTFLMDGIGAMLSAVLLLVLIAPFEKIFGLPKNIATTLSFPILGYVIYSLSCYFIKLKNWKPFLGFIALANFIYCCVTAGIVINYFHVLSPLGIVYFIGEIIIILILIAIEVMVIKKSKN